MKYKYIFFDLDGTIINVKGAQYKAIEDLYELYGFNNKKLKTFIRFS